ncbi:type III pantothenate kinase [Formosa maritima]|uniref:Type III pantothenate kinase n=1 Tax=Formosa maritima TaxID=2592046 RepID=A0A5D0G2R4_9FLAO|nr:type III pantothenate kinase [Formosa maritima]TYA53128.1 type III pantothenate kinase [Formosa maritima]
MNLVIDVGNTFVKLAVFQDDEMFYQTSVEEQGFKNEFEIILETYPNIDTCIISSVGNLNGTALKLIKHSLKVIVLSSEIKLPFINNYTTPKTLGVDRLALISAASKLYPIKNVLVIDAGTCITYDFITKENIYLGGSISPGIRMRYQSLNNLTANLPLIETQMPENIIGNSTESAIHSGVVFGVLNEIEGVIGSYKEKNSDLTVILTGGDANFLSKQLKSSIFANSNFLLQGLNHILQYNTAE